MRWVTVVVRVRRAVSGAEHAVPMLACWLTRCADEPGMNHRSYVYEFRLISEKAEEERREHLRLTLESTGTIYAFGANYDGTCRASRSVPDAVPCVHATRAVSAWLPCVVWGACTVCM